VSLHADPDATFTSSLQHEHLADLSGVSSSLDRRQETEHQDEGDDGLENMADSSNIAGADTSCVDARPRIDDEETEDSPNTSKIKNIVDQQIGKIFGSEALSPPSLEGYLQTERDNHRQSLGHLRPDQDSVQHWWSRIAPPSTTAAAPPTQASSLLTPVPSIPPTEAELFRANLSKVRSLLPASLGVRSSGKKHHPGWQGRFLDKETDRASNIMNGVFSKSDHV
jgi:hypothetical protein